MSHEITIFNFKKNDIVTYPVIIIKGQIKNPNHNELIKVNSNPVRLVNNYFKAIVELTPNDNTIVLTYCCTTTQMKITYSLRKTKYTVLPLYVICQGHDGNFQGPWSESTTAQSACRRITLGMKLIQSVIAEKLYDANWGRKTFELQSGCQVFRSNLQCSEARQMGQEELWNCLGRELVDSDLGHETIKFVAFLGCTEYCGERYEENFTHGDIVKITKAYVALGGGGLALFGTGCLYTWPENLSQVVEYFENGAPVNRRLFMDDSCYRGTLGACFSTTLGSVLHELCHAFDLGHTEHGVMGRGFDDIYKMFRTKPESDIFWTTSCTAILAHHKWLNAFDAFVLKSIKFESRTKFVRSIHGLRVVELRDESSGLVFADWVFGGRILKYSFQLPDVTAEKSALLCVEDNRGNILKLVVELQ